MASPFLLQLVKLEIFIVIIVYGFGIQLVQFAECGPNFSTLMKRRPVPVIRSAYWDAPIVSAEPFITAAQTEFGALIEGASVDHSGSIFATNFGNVTSSLGQISSGSGVIDQQVFFNDTSTSPSFFNGIRFLPSATPSKSSASGAKHFRGRRALAADKEGHRVILLSNDESGFLNSTTFCQDATMVQPNDIAIASQRGRVYSSGQNYTANTVIGDGDLWMCEAAGQSFQSATNNLSVKATRLGVFGRTNGIEVSPDEKTLYLSEAFNSQGKVVSNKVWKFALDVKTGYVWNKSLFVDFGQLDNSGSVDVDGMRTDSDGNLFVTRNGGGEVIKFSPQGQVLLRILLVGTRNPTNLELGGVNGTSLFIVGECAAETGKGCVDVWHYNSSPGRAFRNLNS